MTCFEPKLGYLGSCLCLRIVQILSVLDLVTEGYACRCDSGFEKKRIPASNQLECRDIDECDSSMSCDANAECTNSEGSYSCECKDGYLGNGKLCHPICSKTTCGGYKTCEVSEDNSPECVCRVSASMQERDVGTFCGTDGNTYGSEAELITKSCLLGLNVMIDYMGECQDSCEGVQCLGGSDCNFNEVRGRPRCVCDFNCNDDEYEPG